MGFANVKKLVAEIYKNTTEHSGLVFSLSDTSATIRFNIASQIRLKPKYGNILGAIYDIYSYYYDEERRCLACTHTRKSGARDYNAPIIYRIYWYIFGDPDSEVFHRLYRDEEQMIKEFGKLVITIEERSKNARLKCRKIWES